jgi:pimeloyl-ACP methyl ester carboxylesterase
MGSLVDPELLLYKYIQLRGAKTRTDVCNGVRISSLCIPPRAGTAEERHVVLLHGIGSSGAHFIQIIFRLAAQGYTVHVPDLPGHGLSENFPERLTSHHLFETVVAWMQVAAPPKFALLGNSLGGALAWRYAGREPGRVSKLVVMSPAVGFETLEIWENFVKSLHVPDRAAARGFLDRVMAKSSWYSPFMVPPIFKNMNRKAVRDLLETTQFSELALQHRLPEVNVPTLLIWGKEDKLIPKSNLEWIKRIMPKHVELLEPEGVGHCPQLDSPRWLNGVLKRALS